MTNYNDGKWHGWNGGKCPVHPESVVEVLLRSGCEVGPANVVDWDHIYAPVIAFRVIKEYKEPREFWLFDGEIYKNLKDAEYDKKQWGQIDGEIIHVKEVLE